MNDSTQPGFPDPRAIIRLIEQPRRRLRWPRTLFVRTLLITVMPLIIVQIIVAYIFFTEQWSVLNRRLLDAMAGEIAALANMAETLPTARRHIVTIFARDTRLTITTIRDTPFMPRISDNELARQLATRIEARTPLPLSVIIDYVASHAEINIQLSDSTVLRVAFLRKRIYHAVFYVFIPWMVGSSALLLVVSIILLRNQARAVQRLARHAKRLGAGEDVPNFKPEGPIEIRLAARALLNMRAHLLREVSQQKVTLAGISHDLRTPLTRMRLQSSLLDDRSAAQELDQDIIEMEQLIRQYLDLVQGNQPTKRIESDLTDLLHQLVQARPDPGRITLSVPDGAPPLILVDRTLLSRCLSNLIANAERFADRIEIRLTYSETKAEITIDDDGPGIPIEERRRMFRPFQRIETSRNRDSGGAGLGLSIATQAIQAHKGNIWLATSPMGGLRIQLWVPTSHPDSDRPAIDPSCNEKRATP